MGRAWLRSATPLLDQGVAAASNLMLLVAAARMHSARDVGAVALALTAYTLMLGSSRAWILDPLLLARTALGAEQVLGLLALLGSFFALAGLVAVLAVTGGLSDGIWIALSLGMPMLLLQDGVRYAGFASQRPEIALVADLVWVVAFGSFLAVLAAHAAPTSIATLTWAWVLSAGAGAVVGMAFSGHVAQLRPVRLLFRSFTPFHHSLLADYLLGAGVGQVTTFVLPSLVGLDGIGALRTAQSVFGLTNVLFAAAYVRTLPLCISYFPTDRPRVYRRLVGTSLVLASAGLVMTFVILGIPERLGSDLLGSTWRAMRTLALPVGLATVVGGLLAGASMGLRIVGGGRDILRARIVIVTCSTLAVFAFAFVWHAKGAAWGGLVSSVVSASVYWATLVRLARRMPAADPEKATSR